MDTTIRVKEFLNETFKDALPTNIFKKCIDYFCKSNRKFYKYYSFDSAYTLTNLINNEIYLSNPLSFNDPFDCNLGITPEQVFQASQPEFIHKLLPNLDTETCKHISDILFQDVPISEEQDLKIEQYLKNNDTFIELKNRYNNDEVISNHQIFKAIFKTKEFKEILLIALSNRENLNSKELESLFAQLDLFTKLLDDMPDTQASTFVSSALEVMNRDNNFLEKVVSLADLSGKPLSHNLKDNIYDRINEMQEKARSHFNEIIGISCFSKSKTELLMWGHYANKHTGICVEYDFSNAENFFSDLFLLPVIYTDNRPLIPIEKIYKFKDNLSDKSAISELLPHLIEGFVTKSKKWNNELEWRILLLGNKDMPRKIHLPCISKITAGVNISDDNFEAIKAIAEMKKIPVERLRLKKDRYELEVL